MTEALDRPTIAMFTNRVGDKFRVRIDEEKILEVRLIEATPLPVATNRDDLPIRKDPFSLVLKGSAEHPLQQRMYTVEHEALGSVGMFVVPIGFGEYEVIFN